MRLRVVLILSLVAACGSGEDTRDILERLRDLPEVASVTEEVTDTPGYRYFRMQFDQPVDHDHPDGARFQQYVSLIHRDVDAPTVMLHSGYGNWYHDNLTQVTWLLQANQAAVEHRFFRTSRPTGTEAWQHLTIRQSAADHHRINQALRRIYDAAWLETGASKGGMTSVYHRRFYPDDLDGTIAYVAPISFAAPDYRYEPYVEAIGPGDCRQAIRDLQAELLRNRRAYLEQTATAEAAARGEQYTRVSLPVAVESAVVSLEWSFWQYVGATACPGVPPITATDQALWDFLSEVSPVSSSSDADVAEFEAYYYQAEVELGYPGTMDEHLDGLTQFGPEAFDGAYPAGVTRPPYSPAAMNDISAWVQAEGERLLFIYGEWDPWSGGMFALGGARDSGRFVAAQASHGADIRDLAAADQDQVYARLEAWTGVTPQRAVMLRKDASVAPPREPRVPPAIMRALQLRRR